MMGHRVKESSASSNAQVYRNTRNTITLACEIAFTRTIWSVAERTRVYTEVRHALARTQPPCYTNDRPSDRRGPGLLGHKGRNVRSTCRCSHNLRITRRRAVSCGLHRPTSLVIHRSGLSFCNDIYIYIYGLRRTVLLVRESTDRSLAVRLERAIRPASTVP